MDALRTGGEAFVLGVPRALENVHHTFAFYSSGLKGSSSLEMVEMVEMVEILI